MSWGWVCGKQLGSGKEWLLLVLNQFLRHAQAFTTAPATCQELHLDRLAM